MTYLPYSMVLTLIVALSLIMDVDSGGVATQGSGRPGAWYRFHSKRGYHRKLPTTLFDVIFKSKRETQRDNTRLLRDDVIVREQNHRQRDKNPEVPFWRRQLKRAPLEKTKLSREKEREKTQKILLDILLEFMDNIRNEDQYTY